MKLLSSYLKEMKIASRGFYFYIEVGMIVDAEIANNTEIFHVAVGICEQFGMWSRGAV